MKRLSQCQIRLGRVPAHRFAPSGQTGDWITGVRVNFDTPFLTAGESLPPIRVLVTPFCASGNSVNTFPVPIVDAASTDAAGFVLSARNACPQGGSPTESIGFSYVAIYEDAPGPPHPIGVRFGIAQPWHYAAQPRDMVDHPGGAHLGDRPIESSRISIAPALQLVPQSILMTGTNLYASTSAAVTPVVSPIQRADQFVFDSFSTDFSAGNCAFHWAAFVETPYGRSEPSSLLLVDSGYSDEAWNIAYPNDGRIYPTGSAPDWHVASDWSYRHIYFKEPFSTPPVVFMTARNGADVAMAFDVTPWGFTGALRNSDISDVVRQAHFDWLAIGCGPGCLSDA